MRLRLGPVFSTLVLSTLVCLTLIVLSIGAMASAGQDLRQSIQERGLKLDESAAQFSDPELEVIAGELETGVLRKFSPLNSVRVLKLAKEEANWMPTYGDFDAKTKTITIYQGTPNLRIVFVHEYFHAIAAAWPELNFQFQKLSHWTEKNTPEDMVYTYSAVWPNSAKGRQRLYQVTGFDLAENESEVIQALDGPDFPSDYSKLGPDEMLAETGTAAVMLLEGDPTAHYRLDSFAQTVLCRWWLSILQGPGLQQGDK